MLRCASVKLFAPQPKYLENSLKLTITNDFIKLNTNKNPYSPPAEIFEGLVVSEPKKVRLYPDPVSTQLRKATANLSEVESSQVLAGNGSDDILNIASLTQGKPLLLWI